VGLLAAAAGPSALFAIGASLGERRVSIDRGVPSLVALKLIAHPVLVALAMWGLQVDPKFAAVGVLAASLPTASNAFILSQRYGANTRPISAAIAIGTALAALSVSGVIWMYGLAGG
jgi:predicted permease